MLPPISYMQSVIDSTLNSIVLMAFGLGIYTMVYFGTLYVYLTKKSNSERHVVITAITLLYIFGVLQVISQWWSLPFSFVTNNESRATIFVSFYNLPLWVGLLLNISGFFTMVIADALLLWRCFHVWGNSIRVIAFPSFLLLAEGTVLLAAIIGQALASNANSNISPEAAVISSQLQSAAFFMSFLNSLLTTVLIAYRIYTVSSSGNSTSKKRLSHIIDIVFQSGAAYSLSLMVYAVTAVIPPTASGTKSTALILYGTAVVIPIAGIAPTAMVARVALAASDDHTHASTSAHISGLRFGNGGSAGSANDMAISMDNNTGIERSSLQHRHSEKDLA